MDLKIELKYLETDIIHTCNLNCRGCSHFSPLYSVKDFDNLVSLSEFKKELIRLSDLFTINEFRIMGGEPLLRDDFMDFLRAVKQHFPLTKIALVTNGLLLYKLAPYVSEFNDLNFSLHISNYGLDIFEKYKEILKQIKHLRLDPKQEMYNIGLDLTGSQDYTKALSLCDHIYNNCLYLKDNKLYKCAILGNLAKFQKFFNISLPLNQDELGINIFENSALEIETFVKANLDTCIICNLDYRKSSNKSFAQSKKGIDE